MLAEQGGKCLLCDKPADVVDHCHTTGAVRGLLCGSCNRGLGDFGENVQALKNAIRYLEKYADAKR
jgi:hypothetical protein